MSIEIKLEEAPAEARDLATAVRDFVVEHMLRSVEVFNGKYIIEVREASVMEDEYPDLKTTIKEFDL